MRARAFRRCGREAVLAALLDAAAAVLNSSCGGKADVRRGDYHIILRKR